MCVSGCVPVNKLPQLYASYREDLMQFVVQILKFLLLSLPITMIQLETRDLMSKVLRVDSLFSCLNYYYVIE